MQYGAILWGRFEQDKPLILMPLVRAAFPEGM